MQGKKQQLEPDMDQLTGSKLGKEYIKAVYRHPAYLTYMQSVCVCVCVGFSLWWLLLLRSTGSRVCGLGSCGSWALEHRLNSCGTWAQLLHGMWDPPGPRTEHVSPALASRFFTTETPGKPSNNFFNVLF